MVEELKRRVLFYTYFMVEGTERLMPWRTLVEVARRLDAKSHYEAAICSGQEPCDVRQYEGIKIYSIFPSLTSLKQFVIEGRWEVVYYPVTFRQGLKNIDDLADIPAKVVAYIPGGLSPLSGVFHLIKNGHKDIAMPYLLDTLTPHSWLSRKLHKVGADKIICQAPLTAKDAASHGWKKENVICALPGKDVGVLPEFSFVNKLGLISTKYLLFSGAPAPIRGGMLAVKAFDKIADQLPDVKLVLLMRRDVSSDFHEIEESMKSIVHKNQIIVSHNHVSRQQLFGMFKAAWAVILPFLIVPSEIPLTFFEVMSLGTPVITFENGGTTDYLREGLKIARKRSEKSLGKAMISICQNTEERNLLSMRAKEIMNEHPTWEQTAEIWAKAIEGQNA